MSDHEYNQNSYDAVLARIDQKLGHIHSDVCEMKASHETMATRVSKLENFKYYLMGAIAFFSFGFHYVVSKFKNGA